MGQEITGRINFSVLSVQSSYLNNYQKSLNCPDADATEHLIWLIQNILTDNFISFVSQTSLKTNNMCWQNFQTVGD